MKKMKNLMFYTSVNQRENNQDSCLGFEMTVDIRGGKENIAILLLSDGMGGHEHGEVASRLVVDTMAQLLSKRIYSQSIKPHLDKKSSSSKPIDFLKILYESMAQTNQKILMLIENNKWGKAGATVTAVIITKNAHYWGSIGDSHIYHWQNAPGSLVKVSYDHSVVGILLEEGAIDPEIVRFHSEKHRIVYYMGIENFPAREKIKCVGAGVLNKNDILMLCSDGISGKPNHKDLETIFYKNIKENRIFDEPNNMNSHPFDRLSEELMDCGLRLKETDNQTLVLYSPHPGKDEIGRDISTILEDIDKKQRLLEQIEAEKNLLEQRFNEKSTSLQQAEAEKNNIREDLDEKHRKIDVMEKDKRKLQEEIGGLNKNMNQAKSDIESLNNALSAKQSLIETLKKRIKNILEPKIKDAEVTQVERDRLKQELEDKSIEAMEVEEKIREIKNQLESKNQEIRTAEQEMEKHRQSIDEKNRELENATGEISNLNERLDTLNNAYEKAERELEKLNRELSRKSQTVMDREREIHNLKDKLDWKEKEIAKVQHDKTEISQELEDQKGNYNKLKDEMQDKIKNLKEERTELLGEIKRWRHSTMALASILFIGVLSLLIIIPKNSNPTPPPGSSMNQEKQDQLTGDINNRDVFPEFWPSVPYSTPFFSYDPPLQEPGPWKQPPGLEKEGIPGITPGETPRSDDSTAAARNTGGSRDDGNRKDDSAAINTYTVKDGDKLWKIARKHGVTVEEIVKLNPDINPNLISIGQKLKVPGQKGTSSSKNNKK